MAIAYLGDGDDSYAVDGARACAHQRCCVIDKVLDLVEVKPGMARSKLKASLNTQDDSTLTAVDLPFVPTAHLAPIIVCRDLGVLGHRADRFAAAKDFSIFEDI